MPFDTTGAAHSAISGALDAEAQRLLLHARSEAADLKNPAKQNAKLEKAGKDFEAILLGSWLQQAEQSFATVPGGDGQDDSDSGKDQFQGIAMQALASSLTAAGGIGIAKLITRHLQSASIETPEGQ